MKILLKVKVHVSAALRVGCSLQPFHNKTCTWRKRQVNLGTEASEEDECQLQLSGVAEGHLQRSPSQGSHPRVRVSDPTVELLCGYISSAFTRWKGMKRSVRKVCTPEEHVPPTPFTLHGPEPPSQHHSVSTRTARFVRKGLNTSKAAY